MPANWVYIITYVMVFGFAVYIGFLLGDGWGKRIVTAKAYWLCNLGMLVGVVLLVTLVAVPLIQVCAMGVLAEAILESADDPATVIRFGGKVLADRRMSRLLK